MVQFSQPDPYEPDEKPKTILGKLAILLILLGGLAVSIGYFLEINLLTATVSAVISWISGLIGA